MSGDFSNYGEVFIISYLALVDENVWLLKQGSISYMIVSCTQQGSLSCVELFEQKFSTN